MSRYRRFVPSGVRRLIETQGLPRPDWYVGSAEGGRGYDSDDPPISPAMQRQIDDLMERLDARRRAAPLNQKEPRT